VPYANKSKKKEGIKICMRNFAFFFVTKTKALAFHKKTRLLVV
jgi:hypothetical protein